MNTALGKRKPTWQEWEVAQMTVTTMKSVMGAVVVNQSGVDRRMLSDAMNNLIYVYIGCSKGSDRVMDEVAQQCERIREEHDNSDEANLFAGNLEQVSKK